MPARILIIEDDDDIRDSIVALLRAEGYDTLAKACGIDALALLSAGGFAPDAILLDLLMPTMSGAQFMAAISAMPPLAKIPIIITSAGPVPGDLAKAAFSVLVKPFDLDRLLETLQAACGNPP